MRPVARSRQMVKSLPPSTAVTKMRSPVSTGEECPGGRLVFQTTFLLGPNSTGRFFSLETPELLGPRNWVHSSAQNKGVTQKRAVVRRRFFIGPRIKTI